jgi:hypothetical protein
LEGCSSKTNTQTQKQAKLYPQDLKIPTDVNIAILTSLATYIQSTLNGVGLNPSADEGDDAVDAEILKAMEEQQKNMKKWRSALSSIQSLHKKRVLNNLRREEESLCNQVIHAF